VAAEQQRLVLCPASWQTAVSLYPCPSLGRGFPFDSLLENPVSDLQPKIRLQERVLALQTASLAAATVCGLRSIIEKYLLLTASGWLQPLPPRRAAQGRAGEKAEPGGLGVSGGGGTHGWR